jgi:hypothetical protein
MAHVHEKPTIRLCDPVVGRSDKPSRSANLSALFTGIAAFPIGFSNSFTVIAGGIVLGTFGPNQQLIFPNGGVAEFQVTGINPGVDPSDPTAFPLALDFSTPTADFTMTALNNAPEPSTLLLLGVGVIGLVAIAIGRRSPVLGAPPTDPL